MVIKSRNINSFFRPMVKESGLRGVLEWRIDFPDRTSNTLVPDSMSKSRICKSIFGVGLLSRFSSFVREGWRLGMDEPKKFVHCFKVGLALCLVSLFYYMRTLYDGVGGNAMWAVLTVVVVFEYTVGATLCKCLNKATATLLAGTLGLGVDWIASHFGEKIEPVILQGSVFILAAAVTYSRFMPSIRTRFDYGALIFIVTFSLVTLSGYREGKLFEFAHHRLSTIAIGTCICILTSVLFCPVWAMDELHSLIKINMENLADSLDEFVAEYVRNEEDVNNTKNEASDNDVLLGYRSLLSSRESEESLANFARWEPAHRGFSFGHPSTEYLKVGDSLRSCAYCIEVLNGSSISSSTKLKADSQVLNFQKKQLREFCIKLGSSSSALLKELVFVTNTMAGSPKTDLIVEEMSNAVQEVQSALKALSEQPIVSTNGEYSNGNGEPDVAPPSIPFVEIAPLVTLSSLLIEIAGRIEEIAKAVNELANKA